jgi:hypothetical protein
MNPLDNFFNISEKDSTVIKERIANVLKRAIENEYYSLKYDIDNRWYDISNEHPAKLEMIAWRDELFTMLKQVEGIIYNMKQVELAKINKYKEKSFQYKPTPQLEAFWGNFKNNIYGLKRNETKAEK